MTSAAKKVPLKPFKYAPPPPKENQPVLYRHFSSTNELLYIGISINGVARTKHHMAGAPWFDEVAYITFQRGFRGEAELRAAERAAIIAERPKYNATYNTR